MTTSAAASSRSPQLAGFVAALGAFLIWGIINPVYFKAVSFVDPVEIMAHRIVWTVVLLGGFVLLTQGFGAILRAVGSWRRLGILAVTTVLITTNWGVFIWAVVSNQLVASSLGYYINPLVNVLLGVAFLGERLSRRQLAAVALAALGVLAMIVLHGSLPWISLILPVSFGLYGLIRKKAAIDPVIGLLVETALIFPFCLGYLLWLGAAGAFATGGLGTGLLLLLSGPITGIPMVLFVYGAQRLNLSTVGLLQYIGPTGQLLMGVLLYGEAFTTGHAVVFACIWAALVLFSADTWSLHRADLRRRQAAAGAGN